MEYINTKFKIKKPYESPSLKIHKLRFEGALLVGTVIGEGSDMPAEGEWGTPKLQRSLQDETYEEQVALEKEYDRGISFEIPMRQ